MLLDPRRINKYLYIEKTPAWLVRSVYITGALCWVSVLFGYSRMLSINPIYFYFLLPSIIFFTLYFFISYGINLFYTQLNLTKHHALVRLFWKHTPPPTIDIFLPICGEDIEVIRNTFTAVSMLKYTKKHVYVLDDKGTLDYRELADEFGYTYLSRENKGYMKKAGNIKYGYERSSGDFIVIFDADFAPHPDFVKELLPYMSEPHVAIVQSPQYFETTKKVHQRSMLEYGASYVQQDFYRFNQVGRSNLGAPICCGSNAIYRRSALDLVGGTAQIEHSEDMHTGFNLTNIGMRVKYVPIILAAGLCPDNLHSYFHQQHRWCSGSLSLMLDKKFWKSPISWKQKLCFICGFFYYVSQPISIVLSLQIFLFLFTDNHTVNLVSEIPFIPPIIFTFVIIPLFRLSWLRPGNLLAHAAYTVSYSHAVVTALINKSIGWQPTNTKRSDVSRAYMQMLLFTATYFFLYMSIVAVAIARGKLHVFNLNYYSILIWIFYTIASNAFLLYKLYEVVDTLKYEQVYEGMRSRTSLLLWRIKTFNLYVCVLACALLFAYAI